jgi:hypothetical protein
LVAYGAQNVLLSGNPDFTYFYKSYKNSDNSLTLELFEEFIDVIKEYSSILLPRKRCFCFPASRRGAR